MMLRKKLSWIIVATIFIMMAMQQFSISTYGKLYMSKSHDPRLNYLKINEFSSYGTGNNEWVEIINTGDITVNFTDLHITDQDGIFLNISSLINYIPKPDAYGNYYILVYMGSGTNDLDYHNNGDDHKVVIYMNVTMNGTQMDVFDDDGDDILLYNGTYGTPNCQYIDYVAYSNGGVHQDLDKVPIGSNLKFIRNGYGHYGYIPAPSANESASLVPNGEDRDEACDWYITRIITSGVRYVYSETPGSKNVNILRVDVTDIAPVNQTQGTEVSVLKLKLTGIGTTPMSVNAMYLGIDGTILDNEPYAKIYADSNNNNMWDTGDQAQITYYATFSAHKTSFTTPNIQVPVGAQQIYFVTIKLADDADISHNYSLYLIDVDMGRGPDNVHTDEVFMPEIVMSKYVDISPSDQIPPLITNISFDKKCPLGIGEHNVTIEFNEKMDISLSPNVTYGIFGYEYTISGMWINDTTWYGTFEITNQSPSGELKLEIEARDFSWNYIHYTYTFYVDIEKPYVKEVYYSSLPPYPSGATVNITIVFSEDVYNPNAKLVSSTNEYPLQLTKKNNHTYYLKFTTSTLSQNTYKIMIYNATDKAGNQMDAYYIKNLTMDFENPYIYSVEYKAWPVEGDSVVIKVYCEDNSGVKSVWAVYKYENEKIEIKGIHEGDYWKIVIVGQSVKAPSFDVIIFAEDQAGNVVYSNKTINVVPWWQAMWWLWVIIALILFLIIYLVYDYIHRRRLQRIKKKVTKVESEIPVSESALTKMAKVFKKEVKIPEKGKKTKTEKEITKKREKKKKKELEIPEIPLTEEEEDFFEEVDEDEET